MSEFRPTSVTLSPTAACQLACTYCYIRGGDNPRNLPWEIAEAAIRFTAENAEAAAVTHYDVDFHGQGEPTANWHLFRDAVLFAELQCTSRGLSPRFSVVTNGILNDEKISFIADHKIRVGLSLDGLKESTDRQRPHRGGDSTFDRIMQTIRRFGERGVDFAIRSTVTDANLAEMSDFVDFIKKETNCRYINFEPVCGVGRARDHGLEAPPVIPRFVDRFLAARERGAEKGVEVGYSTCRVDGLRSSFCGAYGFNLNFCVSTEGLVSSCYEVLEDSDPRAEIFIYGRYDGASRRFNLDETRLARLLTLNVTTMGRCNDCYVKWNCGGDCIAKASLGGIHRLTDHQPLERCSANRLITKDELVESLFRINNRNEGGLQ